MNNPETPG